MVKWRKVVKENGIGTIAVVVIIVIIVAAIAGGYFVLSGGGEEGEVLPEALLLSWEEYVAFIPSDSGASIYFVPSDTAENDGDGVERVLGRTFGVISDEGLGQHLIIFENSAKAEIYFENMRNQFFSWLSVLPEYELYRENLFENLTLGDDSFYAVLYTPVVVMRLGRYVNIVNCVDKNGTIELSKIVEDKYR